MTTLDTLIATPTRPVYAVAPAPITEPQRKYLKDLMTGKIVDAKDRAFALAGLNSMTKKEASAKITELKPLSWLPKVVEVKEAPVKLGQGVYVGGSGAVYVFKMRKNWMNVRKVIYGHKKGLMVEVSRFMATKDINDGGHLMTLDEATLVGKNYSFCVCCGRELTDPKSVAANIGPICVKKFGWA